MTAAVSFVMIVALIPLRKSSSDTKKASSEKSGTSKTPHSQKNKLIWLPIRYYCF
ncbi:hypothetical protein GQ55_6G155200 [Panicum hallii var. hallii]|uniref:Uncharacterized protein n=1 Tax=Panicum hallii var. hallii TaxID=1504633 RepID=A0A2T7D6F8_9POAL|nr:hypothetical protein GQ55_6G155200 [Panicum hallii var. hallii]